MKTKKNTTEKKCTAKKCATKKCAAKTKSVNKYEWFTEARFGMFIHWGLYAIPANNEWIKNHREISNEDYQKYFDNFNPDMLDAKEWARMAKEAGMKYFVITSKHHEGFCLWDSKYTDYKATKVNNYENNTSIFTTISYYTRE